MYNQKMFQAISKDNLVLNRGRAPKGVPPDPCLGHTVQDLFFLSMIGNMEFTGDAMPKRLSATEKWENPWFYALDNNNRCLWQFLLDKCDHAGLWNPNWKLAEDYLHFKVDPKVLGDRVVLLQSGRLFINGFLEFQYPHGLYIGDKDHKGNTTHVSVVKLLEKHYPEGPWKALVRGYQGTKDKDKDKDKDITAVNNISNKPSNVISSSETCIDCMNRERVVGDRYCRICLNARGLEVV